MNFPEFLVKPLPRLGSPGQLALAAAPGAMEPDAEVLRLTMSYDLMISINTGAPI